MRIWRESWGEPDVDAFLVDLRELCNRLTYHEIGAKLQVCRLTVARWVQGTVKPTRWATEKLWPKLKEELYGPSTSDGGGCCSLPPEEAQGSSTVLHDTSGEEETC